MFLIEWIARILLGLIGLFWIGVAYKTAVGRQKSEFIISPDDNLAPMEDLEVSIVIPARNEQDNIGQCVNSALEQQDLGKLQVVVLDDASTDKTPEILNSFNSPSLKIIQGGDEPLDGWFGKPWALMRAQKHANNKWLLFVDADVKLHPKAASRAVSYATAKKLDMLSGFGRLEAKTFWEKTLQPAIGGLIVSGNSLPEVNSPDSKKVIANGQFILISREAYDKLGGHAAVKDNVLDDVGMAKAAKNAGLKYHCVFMRTLFECRMYGSLGEIWRGWRKNLFAGLHYSWGVTIGVVSFLFVEMLLPWFILFLGIIGILDTEWLIWGIVLVVISQLVRFYLDIVFKQPVLYGLTQPLAMALLSLLFLDSAWSTTTGKVSWKGRKVNVTKK